MVRDDDFTAKFGNICRLCLKESGGGPMSSIFAPSGVNNGGEDEQSVFATRITSIAQVQINPSDGLPDSICQVCRQQVDKFHDFRLLVEISDRTLRSCLEAAQRESENQKSRASDIQDAHDLRYQEFLMEDASVANENDDLLAVNAILIPSPNGTQVWQICNVTRDRIAENAEKCEEAIEETDGLGAFGYIKTEGDSDLDDFEGVKRCLAQEGTSFVIEKIEGQANASYYTNYCEKSSVDSDNLISTENIGCEPNGNDSLATTEDYCCQLCFASFASLEDLKSHVSDHILGGKKIVSGKECPKSEEIIFKNDDDDDDDDDDGSSYAEESSLIILRENERETIENGNAENERNRRVRFNDNAEYRSSEELAESRGKKSCLQGEKDLSSNNGLCCRYCGKSFLKTTSLTYHEHSVHGRNEKRHRCEECGKEFGKRSELRYHKGVHATPPACCAICNKHFRNVQSFKMHIKRHTLGSRYNCLECGKSYYTNSELARHVQQHTGTREYPCPRCDMSFLSRPELNRHVKYHNGEKTFECKICFKTYYESGHLKVHERVHTGERPFACTVCEKGFITKSKLVRHAKIHQREITGATTSVDVRDRYQFDK